MLSPIVKAHSLDDVPVLALTLHSKSVDATALRQIALHLEDEIRSELEPDDLLTPDDVRGSSATLEEAVTTDGWPTLGATRGKVANHGATISPPAAAPGPPGGCSPGGRRPGGRAARTGRAGASKRSGRARRRRG